LATKESILTSYFWGEKEKGQKEKDTQKIFSTFSPNGVHLFLLSHYFSGCHSGFSHHPAEILFNPQFDFSVIATNYCVDRHRGYFLFGCGLHWALL
jgi:hypothetical protein